MSASEKQIKANKENAKKSTGPKNQQRVKHLNTEKRTQFAVSYLAA